MQLLAVIVPPPEVVRDALEAAQALCSTAPARRRPGRGLLDRIRGRRGGRRAPRRPSPCIRCRPTPCSYAWPSSATSPATTSRVSPEPSQPWPGPGRPVLRTTGVSVRIEPHTVTAHLGGASTRCATSRTSDRHSVRPPSPHGSPTAQPRSGRRRLGPEVHAPLSIPARHTRHRGRRHREEEPMTDYVLLFPADDEAAWQRGTDADHQVTFDTDAEFARLLRASGGAITGGAALGPAARRRRCGAARTARWSPTARTPSPWSRSPGSSSSRARTTMPSSRPRRCSPARTPSWRSVRSRTTEGPPATSSWASPGRTARCRRTLRGPDRTPPRRPR